MAEAEELFASEDLGFRSQYLLPPSPSDEISGAIDGGGGLDENHSSDQKAEKNAEVTRGIETRGIENLSLDEEDEDKKPEINKETEKKIEEKLEGDIDAAVGNGEVGDEVGWDEGRTKREESPEWSGVDGDEVDWYRRLEGKDDNDDKEKAFLAEEEKKTMVSYPQRPGKLDCAFYLRTGFCAYGFNCRFNHPPRGMDNQQVGMKESAEPTQVVQDKDNEESVGMIGQTECKFYLTPGGCRFGISCKYDHTREKTEVQTVKLNFLGLPVRPGEKACPYYMRTGGCKFSANCFFDHPDPTATAGQDSLSGNTTSGSPQRHTLIPSKPSSSCSERNSNQTVSFSDTSPANIPRMLFPSTGLNSKTDCKEYEAPASPTFSSVMNIGWPLFAAPSETKTKANNTVNQQVQMEFPERPGQPECPFFMKTGSCKFRSACKFHHPRNCLTKGSPGNISPLGLPMRPDQPICSYYSRFGICKYGPACKFDHPADISSAPAVGRSYREIVNARSLRIEELKDTDKSTLVGQSA